MTTPDNNIGVGKEGADSKTASVEPDRLYEFV